MGGWYQENDSKEDVERVMKLDSDVDGCGSSFSQLEEANMTPLYTQFVVHDDGCDDAMK